MALSHAESLGLRGEPRGSSICRVRWEEYGRLVGMAAPSLDGHTVWVIALTGTIARRYESYPYMVIVLDVGGGILATSFYPQDAPVPYKVQE